MYGLRSKGKEEIAESAVIDSYFYINETPRCARSLISILIVSPPRSAADRDYLVVDINIIPNAIIITWYPMIIYNRA